MKHDIRLASIDLDRTIIEGSFEVLMQYLGKVEESHELFKRYHAGQINYGQWAGEEASWMQGIDLQDVRRYLNPIKLTPGLGEFCSYLRDREVKVGIISAGADPLSNLLAEQFSLDFAIANEFEVKDGVFTGRFNLRVDEGNKGDVLKQVMDDYGIPRENVLHVGDGISDVSAWQEVGHQAGIYHWNGKEKVAMFVTPVYRDFFELLESHKR